MASERVFFVPSLHAFLLGKVLPIPPNHSSVPGKAEGLQQGTVGAFRECVGILALLEEHTHDDRVHSVMEWSPGLLFDGFLQLVEYEHLCIKVLVIDLVQA